MLPAVLAVAHLKQIVLLVLQMHYALQVVRVFVNVLLVSFLILNGFASLVMQLV